jgi:phosphopantetheinyl transferase
MGGEVLRTSLFEELEVDTHVWYGRVADIIDRFNASPDWLSPEEQARSVRFLQERDRRSFTAGRMLLKSVLSCYFDMPAREWRIVPDQMGAIGIDGVQNPFGVHINLTRRPDWVACAVSLRRCGVDVEDTTREVGVEELANNVMTVEEQQTMAALTADEQSAYFFKIWCLKEAYLKALGVGFYLAPTRCSFRLNHPDGPRVHIVGASPSGETERAALFRFGLHHAGRDHLLVAAHELIDGKAAEFKFMMCTELPRLG